MSGAGVVSVHHPRGGRGHVKEAGRRGRFRPRDIFVLQKKLDKRHHYWIIRDHYCMMILTVTVSEATMRPRMAPEATSSAWCL